MKHLLSLALTASLAAAHAADTTVKPLNYTLEAAPAMSAKFPENFHGHRCSTVVSSIKKVNPIKDEFETTKEFHARLSESVDKPIIGKTKINDVFVFSTKVEAWDYNYNADAQMLNVSVNLAPSVLDGNGKVIYGTRLELLKTTTEKYTGSNAYGATSLVTKTDVQVCGVGFVNYDLRTGQPNLRMQIELPSNRAKAFKQNARLAFFGELIAPYTGKYTLSKQATRDDPTELTVHGDALMMLLGEIKLYDVSSGEIISVTSATPPAR